MTKEKSNLAEIVGVIIALGATTLFWYPPVASSLLPDDLVWRNVAAQFADWAFCLVLIAIVLFWERRPLSSLGFKPLTKANFALGMSLGGFFMVGLVGWKLLLPGIDAPDASGEAGGSRGPLPDHFFFWYAPLAWVTASVCEEIIYRGYAMERLIRLTGRPWIAVALSHVAFVLYHLKDGWDNVVMFSVLLLLFPLYYVRTRDLTISIVGHALVDLLAIVGRVVGSA